VAAELTLEVTTVVVALAREALFLRLGQRRRLREAPCPAWTGTLRGAAVLLVQTGMGAAAVDRALPWVLSLGPARVISAGFCGALVERLEIGCLVEADNGTGQLVTVAAPVLDAGERRRLRERSGAVAVDMESAHVARWCALEGVPFGCVRAVSDGVDTPISAALAPLLEGETVDVWRLARGVLRRPWLVRDLWRLARDSRRAARALAAGIERMVSQGTARRSGPAAGGGSWG
jgi:nucleoside phosphorylase